MLWMTLSAPLNVLPLSDTIRCGNPQRDVNLLKERMKDWVVISSTASKCTALVVQQVYIQIQVLDVQGAVLSILTMSGPAKSTPVKVNDGTSSTRYDGSVGGGGGAYDVPSILRHKTHLRIACLTWDLPLGIQY